MARYSLNSGAEAPDPTAINLTRLITRLQKTLLKPDIATEQRLLSSPYERSKVAANLDYARTLLSRLEQDCAGIKIQSRKAEAQTELLLKRDMIQSLTERLHELDTYEHNSDEDSSEGEDLIGEDTPSEDAYNNDTPSEHPTEDLAASISTFDPSPPTSPAALVTPQPSERDQLFPSSLRARHASGSVPAMDTAQSTSADVTSTTEKMLTHHRTEQEALTADLLAMAKALKNSSTSFSHSLESEDEILKRAVDGLDKNTSGLEAAQKRMGYLRQMTEGRGWWGRMLMYAWIFGMMVTAILIVFVLPKLRF